MIGEPDPRWAHVPDCCMGADFTNLMAICMFGILINVLDFATYQYPGNSTPNSTPTKSQEEEMIKFDINALSDEERRGCIYTRGQALQIMDFVAQNFTFGHPEDFSEWNSVKQYQECMIIHQCQMLFNYKSKIKSNLGAPGCSMRLFRAQISGLLDGDMNVKIDGSNLKATSDCSMLLPEIRLGLTVLENTPTTSMEGKHILSFLTISHDRHSLFFL